MQDKTSAADEFAASMTAHAQHGDVLKAAGRFTAVCRDADGTELWREEFDNLLTAAGKALLLDQGLSGSSYTAAFFMGVISSTSYSAVVATDTMASHSGWLEAGGTNAPTMSSTRQACAWSAASGSPAPTKSLSAGLTFTFTGGGTVQGAFLVGGSGAVNTVGSTAGTLYAGGALSTPQPVVANNTVTLSYSSTLT